MSDIAHLHPLMQEALRSGTVPSREELARALGKQVEDIPDLDTGDEEDTAEPEDPAAEEFRARYHHMVAQEIADWHATEHEREVRALTDFGDRPVPAHVREQIEQDCQRRIQQAWRTFLHQRNQPADDPDGEGGSPASWMQSVL
ncbi:hypothetical protein [Mycobacterium kiyosense]|nr:hypothetical protein [Mycobacterium kiyosense]GLB96324.1 hypothetical protein SRL2020226_31000 [Mycobacterium kiyosense]GLD36473.1 hypothetical protein Mkiyose1595_26930 [Mycobacterium kiyosense]